MRVLAVGVVTVGLAACFGSGSGADGGAADARFDAPARMDVSVGRDAAPDTLPTQRALDVVFVMRESVDETRLRRRVEAHIATSLERWFEAKPDLRLGVLGTDLGLRDAASRACAENDDRGVLRRGLGICARDSYVVDANTERSAEQLLCLLGVRGWCGIEQPLEAALAALSTSSDPQRFYGDSRTEGEVGLGDTLNADFRREGVPLLLVIPTMEDDCSFVASDFFVGPTENYRVRCAERDEGLHSTDVYADAFSKLAPAGVHVFLLAGLPPDLVDLSVSDVADDPRLAYRFDPGTGQPEISCRSETLGRAFAPRRLVEFAAALEEESSANTVRFASVCDDASIARGLERLDELVATIAN